MREAGKIEIYNNDLLIYQPKVLNLIKYKIDIYLILKFSYRSSISALLISVSTILPEASLVDGQRSKVITFKILQHKIVTVFQIKLFIWLFDS